MYAVVTRIAKDYSGVMIDGAIPLGKEGLERILEGQRFWDKHPKEELWHMLELAYEDVPRETLDQIKDADSTWHRSLETWVSRTMDGQPLPDGVTASGIARMITSFNRGLRISRHLEGPEIDVVEPREAFFRALALLMRLTP